MMFKREYQENQLSDDESMASQKSSKRTHLYMLLLLEDTPLLIIGFISTILSSLVSTLLSILMGRVFDVLSKLGAGGFTDFGDFDVHAKVACFSIVALGGGALVINWVSISSWMKLGEKQQLRARELLYASIYKRPIQWFESNPQLNGDIIQVNRCIEELRDGVSECTALLLQSVCSIIALVVTSLIYSWNLTLVILCSSPIIVVVAWILNRKITKFAERENIYSSSSAKILDFNLSNPSFVKIFNSQGIEFDKFQKETKLSRRAFNVLCFYSSLNVAFLRIMVLMMFVQAFWYGFYLVRKGELTSGTVVTTFMSCLLLTDTAHGLTEQLIHVQKAKVALEKILYFIGEDNLSLKCEQLEQKLYPQFCYGDIEFQNVSFSYPSRPEQLALDNISIRFPGRQLTFIIGKSGSGKSTLPSLLLKIYEPNAGKIKIDNFNLNELSDLWLLDNITLVEQATTVFNETLRDNIALGVASKQGINTVSEAQIKEAVQMSLLQKLVFDLPKGLDTKIGTKNKSLSGGQLQRVAIARAKLRDTPILILDESLSALDAIHRELLITAIKQWRRDKTTIIMTHDFTQISDDDYVVMMENGKVVKEGVKYEILNRKRKDEDCFDDKFAQYGFSEDELDSDSDYFEFEIRHDTRRVNQRRSKFMMLRMSEFGLPQQTFGMTPKRRLKRRRQRVVDETRDEEEGQDDEDEKRPERITGLLQIFKFMNKHLEEKFILVLGLIFSVINGVANPLFSFCFSKLLNSIAVATTRSSSEYIMKWALIVVAITVVDGLTTFGKKYCLGYVSESWVIRMRHVAFKQILEHDVNWNESSLHKSNEISALLMNDTRDLRALANEFLDLLITVSVMMTMGLCWSIVVGWKLSLVGLSFIPLLMLITSLSSGVLQNQENQYKTAVSELENHQHETISGIKTIECLRLNSFFNKKFRKLIKELRSIGSQRSIGTGFGIGVSNLLMLLSQGVILYYGLRLVGLMDYTSERLLETLTLLIFTLTSTGSLMNQIPEMARAQRLATYLIRLMATEENSTEFKGSKSLKKPGYDFDNSVEFDHVSFTYPTRPGRILHNVSFKIKNNKIFGIVGASGSGKSTIVSLILKLQVTNGVKIWETNTVDLNTTMLRNKIGIVSQRLTFIEGTIRENLIYGLDEPRSDEEIIKVLKLALIYDFVVSLPQGLETMMGSDQHSLVSGGQAQRLSTARSLLRHPDILILDECTSALDPFTSAEITEMIDKKLRFMHMTIIIVTHHEELMSITDQLIVMKEGSVSEIGSFAKLHSNKSSELSKIIDFADY